MTDNGTDFDLDDNKTDQKPDPQYDNSLNHSNNNGEMVVDLYNANDGKVPRTGGPYLDQVQQEQAEIIRAKMEDREPDLDDPPATAGVVLVPASQLVERDVDKSHYSDTLAIVNEPVTSVVVDTTSGFLGEPDKTQANFDNDMTKVNNLRAGNEFDQLAKDAPEPEKPDNVSVPVSIEDQYPKTTDAKTDPDLEKQNDVNTQYNTDDV